MENKIKLYSIITILLCLSMNAYSQADTTANNLPKDKEYEILFKYMHVLDLEDNKPTTSFLLSGRVMLGSPDKSRARAIGLDFSLFNNSLTKEKVYAGGIVVDRTFCDKFNTGIGILGYFGHGNSTANKNPGIVTNIGYYQQLFKNKITLIVTYRSDFIFTPSLNYIQTMNIGIISKKVLKRKG